MPVFYITHHVFKSFHHSATILNVNGFLFYQVTWHMSMQKRVCMCIGGCRWRHVNWNYLRLLGSKEKVS